MFMFCEYKILGERLIYYVSLDIILFKIVMFRFILVLFV